MPIVLIVPAFVIAALYLRRRLGIGALTALWAATSAVMAATNSMGFLSLASRLGSSVSDAGRSLAIAFMLYLNAVSFGAAAFAIHRRHTDEGPWLTPRSVVVGVIWFVGGGAAAYGIAALAVIMALGRMAR